MGVSQIQLKNGGVGGVGRSLHVEFPLLLAGVDAGEVEQFGKQSQAIFNKTFGGLSDVAPHLFGDFVEVVQLVADDPDEILH